MDWGEVTFEEVLISLREVNWNQPPRPISEFFSSFSSPSTTQKLQTRLKCNAYYYRVNYAIILLAVLTVAFLRNLYALLAISTCALGLLCLNDTFAAALSDRLLRLIRNVYPPLALKIRASSGGHSGLGAPGKAGRDVRIAGVKRGVVAAVILGSGLLMLYRTRALLYLAWALLLGDGGVLLHAGLRTPNLKARLGSAREEFRAVWRGYTAQSHDYTL
ncbi:hypothetical protein WJX73_009395 [Symbiochloris irregularis]|uniref:PRA1 family protein n=1 Tax=Symbiochloris irregularis TaxID=706552 RepID=A0AAW1NWI3_9CHLO